MKDMHLITIRTWEGSVQAFLVPAAELEQSKKN